MSPLRSFHFHASSAPPAAPSLDLFRGRETLGVAPAAADEPRKAVTNVETAARGYLAALWSELDDAPLREITAPESPQVVPGLKLERVQESPATQSRVIHFSQTVSDVPVLGAKAAVEVDVNHGLLAVDAAIADAPAVSPIASLSPAQAIETLAGIVGAPPDKLGISRAPQLAYYRGQGKNDEWHLVYEIRGVRAAPKDFQEAIHNERGHGLAMSPRHDDIELTYLVDAHTGDIVVFYSERAWIDLPINCSGADDDGNTVDFFGTQAGQFIEMRDPIRNIRTFDFGYSDLMSGKSGKVVVHTGYDFASQHPAAVSAHINARRVYDFFNDVLKRDGVDDKGMELVSMVNCTYRAPQGSRDWKNAVWYKQRMWYGQTTKADGKSQSYARYLDVIAHELTHGVTETTSGLKYLNESGALNESISDIFGIIVKNLNGPHAADVGKWDWRLGVGLSSNGGPLRNLSDPTETGDPDHMSKYKNYPPQQDSGGVHTNSGIHNKAAYNVLTSRAADGSWLFKPTDVALFYYLTLTKLPAFATFADTLAVLQNVIRTFWTGRPQEAQVRVDAVTKAYAAVGVT